MRTSNRISAPASIAAIMMAIEMFAAASRAQAQITASNNSGCDILLTLVNSSGSLAGPFTVPSGGSPTTINVPNGFVPTAVEDVNGRTRNFAPDCTACIPLPAVGQESCCVKVCFNSGTNTLSIFACSPC